CPGKFRAASAIRGTCCCRAACGDGFEHGRGFAAHVSRSAAGLRRAAAVLSNPRAKCRSARDGGMAGTGSGPVLSGTVPIRDKVCRLELVQGPDRAAYLVEQFRRVEFGTQRACVDQDHVASDRLEGGAEML